MIVPMRHATPQRRPHRASCLALASVLLAACSQPPPGTTAVPEEATTATDSASALPILRCMPTALVTLRLPIEEGFALEHEGGKANAATVDCLLSLFRGGALKSPLAFDRAYASVFAFHEEDGTRTLASLPRDAVRLFRLGEVGQANVWLLRVDTGQQMEGSRYDVVLSTGRDSGALIDQLLVGATGVMYRRDYDLGSAGSFAIREDTGREDDAGPGYRARYRVEPDGRFALVSGQVLPAAGAEPMPDTEAEVSLSGISLETLPGGFGALAPIRALLFGDGRIEEKAIVRLDTDTVPLMLAIGRVDTAGFALYVLDEVPDTGDGNTLYRVSGLALEPPPHARSAEVRGQRWQAAPDGHVRISLSLRYTVARPGGDPAAGAPATMRVDVERAVLYDPATGALVPERAD